MDRTAIAPLVRERLGLPSDDNRVNNTSVYMAINAALRRMSKDFDWPWLITTEDISLASGDSSSDIPDNWVRTLWITDSSSGYEIRNTQRRAMLKYGAIRGYPRAFSTQGRTIAFAPTSNRSLDLLHAYVREEEQLTTDSDEPLCPDNYIDIIVLYAAIILATKLRDTTMLASLKEELNDWKNRAKETTSARPNLTVRVRNSWRLW